MQATVRTATNVMEKLRALQALPVWCVRSSEFNVQGRNCLGALYRPFYMVG